MSSIHLSFSESKREKTFGIHPGKLSPRDNERVKDETPFCGPLDGTPCPLGACPCGEQKAGWPLPVFVDYPGGGSPTGGWGMIGPEDIPIPGPLILDVLFYSVLLWLASGIYSLRRWKVSDDELL